MNLLSVENISKSYGEKILFQDLNFGISEGEKIGLIGVNGTGKSSLLKVLAGIEPADSGKIMTASSLRIEYLPQDPHFDGDETVLEHIYRGSSPVMVAVRGYEEALNRLNRDPGNERLQAKLAQVSQTMDALDAWQLENEAKTVLGKLGISDHAARIGTLSGGQQKRVAIAAALLQPADLLILDEPTNHIDNRTVDWLEQYLQKRRGALLMITHDRYFLDRVVNRMLELDRGQLYAYTGNYSRFLELKADREEREQSAERKRQNLLRSELAWIRRGAKARTTKQKARIERFEALRDDEPAAASGKVEIAAGAARLGKQVIELADISKSVPGRTLIRGFECIVQRHDRIGIVGDNGAGKSTLLRMMAGQQQPDSGTVLLGQTVRIGFFTQNHAEMNDNMRVIEYIKEQAEVLQAADGSSITASQMLERFLFSPSMQWTPIAKLSGGERRRLYLLRILMSAPNVLLLDEPTNDLDIQTLAVLEDYLDDFPGAVISVSHDRYFLDRTAERIIAFEGNGQVTLHVGNYTEYREFADKRQMEQAAAAGLGGGGKSSSNVQETGAEPNAERRKERALKFTFKEQKEYEEIDGLIAAAEEEQQRIAAELDAAGSDSARVIELAERQEAAERRLDELLERWTYLNELAEEIARSRNG